MKDIERIVAEFLSVTVASHQRRCCNTHGVRRHTDISCDEHTIDPVRLWCRNCGRTVKELIEGRAKK